MLPRMSAKEFELFLSFVRVSESYVEFGTGGSTFIASQHVKRSVISVDSSMEWIDKVRLACAVSTVDLNFIYVDIGATGEWGYPMDGNTNSRWPAYHENVWNIAESKGADLYMVDGRFRVACFAQTVIHCDLTANIAFHDFSSRENYHCIREIAKEIAVSEDMSFFRPLPGVRDKAEKILEQYRFVAS